MPVKLFYLITELGMGGAERTLLHLLTNLNREHYEPTVTCLFNGDGLVAKAILALDIPVYDIQMRWRGDLGALYRLHQFVRSQNPTILHTSLFHANLSGRISANLAGIPIIINSERTMTMESEWRYKLNRWTISMVDRVVAVSKNVREFCINHIRLPAQKVVVINNGVELPILNPERKQLARQLLDLPEDVRLLGAVSRLESVKGIDDLILAFAQVREKYDAHLVVVGDGTQRAHLESLAHESGVAEWIRWTGFRVDVVELLPAIDLFIQPSHHEGMPNAVLEAMAAGLPVIATDVGGTSEVVDNRKTGLLIPPRNPYVLGETILTLLENPVFMDSMGRESRKRVRQKFSVVEMVGKTEQLYEQLLVEKGIH